MTIDQALQAAVQHHQAGRFAEAERTYRRILSENPRHPDALHLMGLIAGQKGRHREASDLIARAIEAAPKNAAYHCNLGVFLQYQGQLDKAAAAYQRAISLQPNYPEAHGNLGIILAMQGQLTPAIACYRRSLQQRPDQAEIMQNLGNALRMTGDFAQAVDCYQKVLALNPELFEACFNLGIAYAGSGQLEKAAECYRRIIAMDAGDPAALCSLGVVLEETGDVEQAVAFFERAIELQPSFLDAYANLADAFNQLGRFDRAIDICRQALEINPQFADGHSNMGLAFAGKGEHHKAIESYQQAISLNPDLVEAYCNLGNAYCDIRDYESAIQSCQKAVALRPDFADAHASLANAFLANGSFEQSAASNLRAIAIRPQSPEALVNLGLAYVGLGRVDEAIDTYRRAIELNPSLPQAYGNLGNALKDKGLVPEAIAAYRQALDVNPYFVTAADNLLYTLLFDSAVDAETMLIEGRKWDSKLAKPLRRLIQPHSNDRDPDRSLRIGYVSPDFSDHPVGRFMLALIAAHNRANFQIFCYADVRRSDDVTAKLQSHAHTWRNISRQSDTELTQTIREDRIDILVDLALHMSKNRLLVFARKPAPVQATFAGYPGSTGLSTIDYRITDPYLDPPGDGDRFYTEKSIRLPDTFWCDNLMSEVPVVSDLPLFTNGYVTFGSLNNFCKVNDSVLSLWSMVLKAVNGSRLIVLVPPGSARQRVLDRLSSDGIEPERIEFVGYQPRPQYLQTYHRIDIGLDTCPYNGHATSFDSFWMGVPVVALVGNTVVGRAGLSQLMNLGLQELIAHTREEYVRIATELGHDPKRLSELRRSLRQRMQQSPLMDADRFARGMEDAYRAMWQNWCRQPADLDALLDQQVQTALEHYHAGRMHEAQDVCRQILIQQPDRDDALRLLARALSSAGNHDEAVVIMARLAAISPGQSDYHNDLAVMLRECGRIEEAIAACRRAIELRPDNANAHKDLGRALKDLGRFDDALKAFHKAVEFRPSDAEARSDLGNILNELGEYDNAAEAHRYALRLDPSYYKAHNNLGVVLLEMGLTDEAIESFKRTIDLKPDYSEAYSNLGNAFKDEGHIEGAISSHRRAIELRPDNASARDNLLLALHYSQESDPQTLLREHEQFGDRHVMVVLPHPNDRDPDRRLRIGYVSPDFRAHPVGQFMLPVMSYHNRRDYEIHCFSNVSRSDEITAQFRHLADHWHDIRPLNDDSAAQLIRSEKIDILVDLASHTAGNRLLVFARKPAPVQASYLAYCGTTGLAAIDYLLADPYLLPPDQDRYFSEEPIRLSHTYWCYRPMSASEEAGEPPVKFNGYVTFACLNNFAKVSPSCLNLWCRLLQVVPNSKLILHAKQGNHRQRAYDLFAGNGVDPSRVEFTNTIPYVQYLQQYRTIDIALDPFPFAGGTSTCDSLWMGVPVVSLAGQTPVSRGGLSILSNIGLPELVGRTSDEYLNIAIKLATDQTRLTDLRRSLRQHMRESALMDEKHFVADLELAYRMIWKQWCRNPQ